MSTKDTIIFIVLICVIVFGLCLILFAGADKNEISECKKWQEYAAQYEGFYLVQWQADQCKAHSIQINAPIK